MFRLALEAGAVEGVDRVVFLALRGEKRHVECFWPVPLDEEPEQVRATGRGQLQLLSEDGASSAIELDDAAPSQTPRAQSSLRRQRNHR